MYETKFVIVVELENEGGGLRDVRKVEAEVLFISKGTHMKYAFHKNR
jgi:hypothetical protein